MQTLLSSGVSGLGAFSVGMDVVAHNIANLNTPFFKAGRIEFETGPHGHGTQVGAIHRDVSLTNPYPFEQVDVMTDANIIRRDENTVQLEREFVDMIAFENGYSANVKVVQSHEQMLGTLMDMKI
jgi:flagellar basal-body rod protein FlgB